MSKSKISLGECFEVGQVWVSPLSTLYRCMEIGHHFRANAVSGKKQALLRAGMGGQGRKVLRDWDKVEGWSIHARPLRPEDVPNEPWVDDLGKLMLVQGRDLLVDGETMVRASVTEDGRIVWWGARP